MKRVKLDNTDLLKKFQFELTLKIGKKISQKELLEKCVEFTYNRLEDFLFEILEKPQITDELIAKIRQNIIDAPLQHLERSDDELL